jgi:hypothetical protein
MGQSLFTKRPLGSRVGFAWALTAICDCQGASSARQNEPQVLTGGDEASAPADVAGDAASGDTAVVGEDRVVSGRYDGRDYLLFVPRAAQSGAARPLLLMLHGCGHGWLGGSAAGSFTEPRGPDASALLWSFLVTVGGSG